MIAHFTTAERLTHAVAAERAGRTAEAKAIALALVAIDSGDARLLNDLGSLLMRLGEPGKAASVFGSAKRIDPANSELVLNQAIAFTAIGKCDEAMAVLKPLERTAGKQARYWSIRANAARQTNQLTEARRCYMQALRCDPAYSKAQQGLAQVALERGELNTVALFDEALRSDPGNPYLWRGKAEALDSAGDRAGALQIARQIVQQAPRWIGGLDLLAQLRLGAGETDYTSHYAEAADRYADDPNIPIAWIAVLAGLDNFSKAAEVAQKAATRFPALEHFKLLEAVHAGGAGDDCRAEALFATLTIYTAERYLHEARHRIRLAAFDLAEQLLAGVLDKELWNVGAWALRDLVWRATGDSRHHWLHGQEGLVRKLPLIGDPALLPEVIAKLRDVHARSALPLNQSLRGGTQTRGSLFARHEPIFGQLKEAIERTLAVYQDRLPRPDATHPLLRYGESVWSLAGSWSVRLTGGGDHHTAHIHPQGIVSSALYLAVPEHVSGDALLELGRPPPDLRLDLSPLTVVEPEAGFLALFPSTLYHGTTSFGCGERMSVAFDVIANHRDSI